MFSLTYTAVCVYPGADSIITVLRFFLVFLGKVTIVAINTITAVLIFLIVIVC